MGTLGQMALGAFVAVCLFGASISMDGARLDTHQLEIAACRLSHLQTDLVGTKVVEGAQFVLRALSHGAN